MTTLAVAQNQELVRLIGQLSSGQSSLITGKGKTSLLKQITNRQLQANSDRLTILYIDCKDIPHKLSPEKFWRDVLKDVSKQENLSVKIRGLTEKALKEKELDSFFLEDYFENVAKEKHRIALLLDHADHLLRLEPETTKTLLSRFRAFSSLTNGLVLLFAAQRTLTQFNEQTALLNPHGSPYFNTYLEIHLD
jgi:Cdc6-like AAA superfamily ATPase